MQVSEIGKGYQCPDCESVFLNQVPLGKTYYELDEDNYKDHIGEHVYANFSSREISVWACGNECEHREKDDDYPEPEIVPIWECGRCETYYVDKDAALDCCR